MTVNKDFDKIYYPDLCPFLRKSSSIYKFLSLLIVKWIKSWYRVSGQKCSMFQSYFCNCVSRCKDFKNLITRSWDITNIRLKSCALFRGHPLETESQNSYFLWDNSHNFKALGDLASLPQILHLLRVSIWTTAVVFLACQFMCRVRPRPAANSWACLSVT